MLLAPVVSEKGTYIADKHAQVIFRVLPDATKPEIKAAVELMFKVEVDSVADRQRRRARKSASAASSAGARSWKKAYVCLKPGQEINFAAEKLSTCHCIKVKPTSPGRRAMVKVVHPTCTRARRSPR